MERLSLSIAPGRVGRCLIMPPAGHLTPAWLWPIPATHFGNVTCVIVTMATGSTVRAAAKLVIQLVLLME